jgi:hypothetical protein
LVADIQFDVIDLIFHRNSLSEHIVSVSPSLQSTKKARR